MSPQSDGLRVVRLRRTNAPNQAEILYTATLENAGCEHAFEAVIVEWKYHLGMQTSIGLGDVLRPKMSYVVDLPLDVDSWDWDSAPVSHRTPLNPTFIIAASPSVGISSANFELQLHYSFVGRIDWHPQYDWDIIFSVHLEAGASTRFPLIPKTSWRERDVED
jgi:hypothetical protein